MSPEHTLLHLQHTMTIYPSAPFSFEGTVFKPSHFPSSDNLYNDNIYWFSMLFEGQQCGIKMLDLGTIDKPEVQIDIFALDQVAEPQLTKLRQEVEYRFDMNVDLHAFYSTCGNDPLLKPAIERWRGTRVSTHTSLYEFLVIATVLQNANVRRSVQMMENLFQRFGSKIYYDEQVLSVYWSPDVVHKATEEDLRSLKLGYRAKMLKRQAQIFAENKISETELRSLGTSELKSRLLQLYGIGPASVWYLLFEVFKRYEAFEYISPWEQKIYSQLLFGQEETSTEIILQEVNNRWGKWKMLASHYIFEDLFWRRKHENIPWLEKLIRL